MIQDTHNEGPNDDGHEFDNQFFCSSVNDERLGIPCAKAALSRLRQLIANEGPRESGQLLTTQFRRSLFRPDKFGFPTFAAADSLKTQLDHNDGPRLLGQERFTQDWYSEVKLDRASFGVCAHKIPEANSKKRKYTGLKSELHLASNALLIGAKCSLAIISDEGVQAKHFASF